MAVFFFRKVQKTSQDELVLLNHLKLVSVLQVKKIYK